MKNYMHWQVYQILDFVYFQDVLLMVSDITPWTVRAVEEHRIVESWLRGHIMEKIYTFMVS